MYCSGILIILAGLYILCRGEKASAEGSLLSRNEMRSVTDPQSVEMHDDRPDSASAPASPQASPTGGSMPSPGGE